MALFMKAPEDYTMRGTGRKTLRGGSECKFDDQHASEGRF
jgi:hypothetical protein